MKYIWLFVGLILFFIGLVILISGLYALITGHPSQTVLASLHPEIWWSIFMMVFGLIFIIFNRKPR